MEAGSVRLRDAFWGFLLLGLSRKHCYFHPGEGGKEERILHNSEWRPAFRCARCLTVVWPGPEVLPGDEDTDAVAQEDVAAAERQSAEPITCLGWKAIIPADVDKCPSCGWTYRPEGSST